MEQLILDIHSDSDAALIKEFLKKFKQVHVQSFSSSLSSDTIRNRIHTGLDDADNGRVTPLEQVKIELAEKLKNHRK